MKTYEEPALVPRRLAFRLCGYLLLGRASEMRSQPSRSARRHRPAVAKPGRDQDAAQMLTDARTILSWTGDDALCAGEGIDAAVLGCLMAWLGGGLGSKAELIAELAAVHGRDVTAGLTWSDVPAVVRRTVTSAGG
jgi:hypothetical protein